MKWLRFLVLASVVLLLSILVMPGPAVRSAQKPSPDKSKTIYVVDFELDAQNVTPDEGPGGRSGALHGNGPIRRATGHGTSDPEQQAQHIVNLMSDSLVSNFQKAGYIAQRTAKGSESIGPGYVVKGVFTEVDEGNRVRRAVIGFGAGEVKMQLYVNVADTATPKQNMYSISQEDTSNKRPGAVITMNPIAAGVNRDGEKRFGQNRKEDREANQRGSNSKGQFGCGSGREVARVVEFLTFRPPRWRISTSAVVPVRSRGWLQAASSC